MGYGTRAGGIRTFTPDDTATTLFLNGSDGITAQDLLDRATAKWGNVPLDELTITAEYIHTDCLTYPSYDSSDWTLYLRIDRHTA